MAPASSICSQESPGSRLLCRHLVVATWLPLVNDEARKKALQVASKKAKKGDSFAGCGTPDPFNQNDDDQVHLDDAGKECLEVAGI